VDLYTVTISLDVGDIVVDSATNESGILSRRINLLENSLVSDYDLPGINAWEILWSGKALVDSSIRMHVYTESGLINMIREGLLQLYKGN
jgi:hypothetical protein